MRRKEADGVPEVVVQLYIRAIGIRWRKIGVEIGWHKIGIEIGWRVRVAVEAESAASHSNELAGDLVSTVIDKVLYPIELNWTSPARPVD